MDMLILIVFLLLIALLSILVDRRWQRFVLQRRQKQAPTPPVANGPGADLVDQIVSGWQKRMGWRARPTHDQSKLRAWLLSSLADQPSTQAWLAEMTDDQFSELQSRLQHFCDALNIDLAWLNEQTLSNDPALHATVQRVVLHSVQAQHQAANVQAELRAFKIYQALELRPYSYEFQPLIQQLYTQVINAGLAAPARPEALLATEKIRVEHMLRAIRSAASANRPTFYQILNELNGAAG